jgi:hypothetical protein
MNVASSSEWKTGSINLSHHACACIEEEYSLSNDDRRADQTRADQDTAYQSQAQ